MSTWVFLKLQGNFFFYARKRNIVFGLADTLTQLTKVLLATVGCTSNCMSLSCIVGRTRGSNRGVEQMALVVVFMGTTSAVLCSLFGQLQRDRWSEEL